MPVETVKEVLVEARSKIERGWTTRHLARDSSGRSVPPHDESAVCWCVFGAMDAVDTPSKVRNQAEVVMACCVKTTELGEWNDQKDRTQEEVLKAFDEAIERC